MSFLLFDLNHTSKQRVHVREVIAASARILLEKSNKLNQFKGSGAQKPCFKLREQ